MEFRTHFHPRLTISGFPRITEKRLSTCSLLPVLLIASIAIAGCGGVVANKAASASTGNFTISPGTLAFGAVAVGTTATEQVTLTNSTPNAISIASLTISGAFTVDGAGTLPATVAASGTLNLNVHFSPTAAENATGQLVIASSSLVSPSTTIQLSGTGVQSAPSLSSLSCANSSMASSGTDACTVTLSAAAPSSGIVVYLSSDNLGVMVPFSLTVPANATSGGFNASVNGVSIAETATITSSENGSKATFSIGLEPAGAPTPTLSLNAGSVAFGDVTVGSPATQSLTLTSSGSAAVTVSNVSITGSGFTFSGATFPLTLNPTQTATLSVQFNPASAGAATGQLTIASNSSSNPQMQIGLTGTGEATSSSSSYQVNLSWTAPSSSSDTVSGYNIYRATGSSSSFQKLNSSINAPVSYADSTVQGSTTYEYYVTSVDSSGAESVPSNTATVAVP